MSYQQHRLELLLASLAVLTTYFSYYVFPTERVSVSTCDHIPLWEPVVMSKFQSNIIGKLLNNKYCCSILHVLRVEVSICLQIYSSYGFTYHFTELMGQYRGRLGDDWCSNPLVLLSHLLTKWSRVFCFAGLLDGGWSSETFKVFSWPSSIWFFFNN